MLEVRERFGVRREKVKSGKEIFLFTKAITFRSPLGEKTDEKIGECSAGVPVGVEWIRWSAEFYIRTS